MLFNSYVFILLFLPATLIGFFAFGHRGNIRAAVAWLVGASLFFYGFWNPAYLVLLLVSTGMNYLFGIWIANLRRTGTRSVSWALALAVGANLLVLGYFKYANFIVGNVSSLLGEPTTLGTIILPLGISFFTFQKIAYLVDVSEGENPELNFGRFALFVFFFPQLIAGPIVHPKEVLPQFADSRVYRLRHADLAFGITLFTIGLFKKVVLADNVAPYSSAVFDAAAAGAQPSLVEAWGGALAYTLQLYFDFSGYSDMAVGLGRMFGIHLPINFNSPYKAVNIIDFWRRWHITLSRFLRDYLYIPLGGNRRGPARRHVNLFITMLLGGIWHGAGWTFVIWGALHGAYLGINHAWHALRHRLGMPPGPPTWWGGLTARALTLLAVIVGWVFFRAASVDAAWSMLQGMAGLNGVTVPAVFAERLAAFQPVLTALGVHFGTLPYFAGEEQIAWIAALFAIAFFAPNSNQFMGYAALGYARGLEAWRSGAWLRWSPTRGWAVATACILLYTLTQMSHISEFLYFQF
jgi:D-alanyl-lipoteichoic acid acyltransferase DltB (MBOAT superfamily)